MQPQHDDAQSYRTSHLGSDAASRYDEEFWHQRTARGIAWTVEQLLVDRALASVTPSPGWALDFACGTGRVLSKLQFVCDRVVGVDISPDMLEVAQALCPHATLVVGDVTTDPGLVGGPFDVITAFRFFLNAEPCLRAEVLDWMRGVLAPEGVLIANFHLNPYSLRGTYLRLRWGGRWRTPVLSVGAARDMLASAGFEVVEVIGYDFLPYRRTGARLRMPRLRARTELFLAGRGPAVLAGSFIVVARKLRYP